MPQADDSMMETRSSIRWGSLRPTTKKEAAQALEEFLQSEEAMNVFVEAGFSVNQP